MATYVNNLRLTEITTGDESGTWGTTTNSNWDFVTDAFGYGVKNMASDADVTYTMADGSVDTLRSMYLKITSGVSLTQTRTITIAPNTVSKVWIIENATTGSQSITIAQGSGATVTIANGVKTAVYTDGAGAGAAVVNANPTAATSGTVTSVGGTGTVNGITLTGTVTSSGSLTLGGTLSNVSLTTQVTGTLPVANGGTGTTSTTFANLTTNVTGTLPVANGGTGATTLTANNVILGNGTAAPLFVAPGTTGNILTSDGTTWTSAAPATGVTLSANNAFTGANTFFNSTGQTFGTGTSTQDGIVLTGRAGGSTSLRITLTPATLAASRTLTLPEPGENVTLGYLNIPQNSRSAAYTLVLTDAGKHIFHPSADTTARTFTIPANGSVAFPIGTAVTFINQNGAGVITIAITTDTMRLAGAGTTGSRTLAANGVATAVKVTSTEWIISGTGLT
jgi:hypothetical protein